MIWLVMGILILGVLLYMAYPLYANTAPKMQPDSEVAEYLTQISDIDVRLGNAGKEDDISALELAKVELQRQVLAKTKADADTGPRSVLLSSLFIALAFGALGLYTTLGRPDLTKAGVQKPVLSPAQAMVQNAEPDHENTMTLEEAVAGLEAKLKENDQDPQGWILYARSLMSMRRFDDALGAYEKVLLLTNNSPNVMKEMDSAIAYIEQIKNGGASQANSPSKLPANSPGPSAEQMQAAASMTPAERQAMIKNMVDGLAAKLTKNPNDVEGWIRLLRARKVMGQNDAVESELTLMKKTFKSSPETIKRILTEAGWE